MTVTAAGHAARSLTTDQSATLAADVLDGLAQDPPTLPTKWLYDDRGSRLFDEITRLPEYYPTRRETAILTERAREIAERSGAATLIELGSGTSTKTRLLLDAFDARAREHGGTVTYVPVDVSTEMLARTAEVLSEDYPRLAIVPVEADFAAPGLVFPETDGPRIAVFLGGTIGNFDDEGRAVFFSRIADALHPGDMLLLGADLVKDAGRLVAAYNDEAGVTADFNKNMIEVLRRGLDAEGLYADDFEHIGRWNPERHRIEMWLRARRDVDARFGVLDRDWHLDAGTEILTEISTKFEVDSLATELGHAGLSVTDRWTDADGDVVLVLARRDERP